MSLFYWRKLPTKQIGMQHLIEEEKYCIEECGNCREVCLGCRPLPEERGVTAWHATISA